MSEPAIDITGLEFAWAANPTLLQIAQLRIERGERVFLTGASGSGKSTLLGLIAGVLLPRKGTLRVMGSTMNALRASERDRFRGEHLVHFPDVQPDSVFDDSGECHSATAVLACAGRAAGDHVRKR